MRIPKASIVVPLLNQPDSWLIQAVVSALNQTAPCEVVVVTSPRTGASNIQVLDGLRRQHDTLRVLRQETGAGFAAALNLGIRQAAANRIGFLMSDDWLDPQAVEACLAQDADIVSTGRKFYSADGSTALTGLAEVHTPEAYRALRKDVDRATFLGHFLLFRREIFERVGGVDETVGDSPGVDDFDFIWCMLERGASAAIVPEAFYNYRDHEGERLTRQDREAMLATFHRILDKHPLSARDRRKVLAQHSPWFGVSMWTKYRELCPQRELGPLARRLQKLYRKAVPLRTRISLHDRVVARLVRAGGGKGPVAAPDARQ